MTVETLSEAQHRLAIAGYGDDLIATSSGLRSLATGTELDPATLRADEIVRFEGASDPDDEAILIAVATRDGKRLGTFTTPYGPAASAEESDVLQHLHRVIVSEQEQEKHGVHDHVAASFPDRKSAEAAIEDLRKVGLGSEHLGVAIHQSDKVIFERDEEDDLVTDVEIGVARGAAMGVVGGMLLFATAVPGIGALSVGGIMALGAASGFGGAMLGAYFGLAAGSEEFDEHQQLRETNLAPGEVLIVACAHDHRNLVEAAFQRHGGRVVPAAS